MTAYERGVAAATAGEDIKANPYDEYFMRRHAWSGWRSQVSNPAWCYWRQGYYSVLIGRVKDAIRKVLEQHGEMFELEFGLAVMREYQGELTSGLMNSAVSWMKQDGELIDTLGTYKLTKGGADRE